MVTNLIYGEMKGKINCIKLAFIFILQFNYIFAGNPAKILIPEIYGNWWEIASTPELGKYNKPGQEPVDFCIWQAADGSWQALSCVRNTAIGGHGRLFYQWEGKNLTDKNWKPVGVTMISDTGIGEPLGGLQAPYVFKDRDIYYMFYGDWNNICLARSTDGKIFTRIINSKGNAALFSEPYENTRDAMVLKIDKLYYCYYTCHTKNPPVGQDSCAIFCRVSSDLLDWSEPVNVCSGGSPADGIAWYGADAECPFVVKKDDVYYLFRNQLYGPGALNTQYASANPLHFGVRNNDSFLIGKMNVAAPEIIEYNGEYYMATLNPNLDGIRISKLKWVIKL